MKDFILMLQFLTRIPINIQIKVEEDSFKKGMVYFPLVGLVIGALNVLVFLALSLVVSDLLAIIFMTLFNVCLTGGLHLDGLADTCDGIYSSRSKGRMLEIMKDSRIGTNGGVAIFFDLTLRIALLNSISSNNYSVLKAILIASVLSRTILVLLSYISTYARKEGGLGNLFIGKITTKGLTISLIMGILIMSILLGYKAMFIFLPLLVIMFLYEKYIKSKIGGMTGDTLGAAAEITEILVLFIYVILQGCGVL